MWPFNGRRTGVNLRQQTKFFQMRSLMKELLFQMYALSPVIALFVLCILALIMTGHQAKRGHFKEPIEKTNSTSFRLMMPGNPVVTL